MTSHSDAAATDNNRAAVAGTVATTGDSVGNGAVATVTVTNPDDETIATDANHLKSSFPRKRESRTKNSAQPTEFNAGADTVDKVRFAQLSSLDTGSSPVWSVVADADSTDNNRAVVVGTVVTVAVASATVPPPPATALSPTNPPVTSSAWRRTPSTRGGSAASGSRRRRIRLPTAASR